MMLFVLIIGILLASDKQSDISTAEKRANVMESNFG
jgi:hypothetical protein